MKKLIKFGAEWCGPCRFMDSQLEKFTACPVEKYDIDNPDTEELIDKYGNIRSIPVIILVDENETEIKRWVGSFDLKEVEQYL